MPYKIKGQCVYKKDGGTKVGCTKGDVNKYLVALHTNVVDEKENIEEVRKIVRKIIKNTLNEGPRTSKVKLINLMIDGENMERAYNKAVDTNGESSRSIGEPLKVFRLRDGTLLLADGNHRIADKIFSIENAEDVLNLEFPAKIHRLSYENLESSPDGHFIDWEDFTSWLHNIGNWIF